MLLPLPPPLDSFPLPPLPFSYMYFTVLLLFHCPSYPLSTTPLPLPCLSPASPLPLPCFSPASPLPLPCLSPASTLPLPCLSPASTLPLPCLYPAPVLDFTPAFLLSPPDPLVIACTPCFSCFGRCTCLASLQWVISFAASVFPWTYSPLSSSGASCKGK